MGPGLPVAKQRERFEKICRLNLLPFGTKIKTADIGGMPARWISNADAADDRAILYFHGGAYTIGSSHTHRSVAAYLAKTSKTKVLVIDYRLAPEYPYPAAIDDGIKAYRWLMENGFSHRKLVVAGDSAGGGLVLATLAALRDAGIQLPAAAVCFSPWADLEGSGESYTTKRQDDPVLTPDWLHIMARHYAGENNRRLPTISPVYADMKDFSPLLIQVGSDEILLSDSHRLAARAREAGVDVKLDVLDSMCHLWTLYAGVIPEAHQAIQDAGRFVFEHLESERV